MNIQFIRFISSVLVLLAFSTEAFTAPGDLDPTFNGIGYLQQPLAMQSGPATSSIVQADGKIVVVGSAFVGVQGETSAVAARYNPDGTLDSFFGVGGINYVASGGRGTAMAIALQPDGKMILAGFRQNATVDFMVARYDRQGRLDTTFDADGIVDTDFGGSHDNGLAAALQPDGKIVVVGQTDAQTGDYNFAIARYNADGTLDTSFDGDGKKVIAIGVGSYDMAKSVAVQLDGKILVSGTAFAGANVPVLRLNPDGTSDTSFGTNGMLYAPFSAGYDSRTAVAVQWDGKIVVGGNTIFPFDLAVARYNPNGSLDTTFDGDGYVVTNINPPNPPIGASDDHFTNLALQSDGKIVVIGRSNNIVPAGVFSIVKYNADGSLETSFGNGGKVITEFPGSYDIAQGVTSAPDGRAIVVGAINAGFGIARYQGSPVAATAKIGGRIVSSKGQGISGARVVLIDAKGDTKRAATTNGFGYYNFYNLPTGANYTISVSSKRTQFYQNTQSLRLYLDVLGLHFVGTM